MDVEATLDYVDQALGLGDEGLLEHVDPDDEEMEAEPGNVPSRALGPDVLHDEITRLAAGLASQDEGEKLVALSAMQKAVTGKDGEKVIVSYVLASPQCAELMNIWLAGPASATAVPLMQLLYHLFKTSVGKDGEQVQDGDGGDSRRRLMTVKLRLDKLARSIVRNRMKDIYSHLSSGQRSRHNGVLLLLSAMVLRGRALATEIATTFDFTLEALKKLARPRQQPKGEIHRDMLKRPSRIAFVDFAMSFLEVGDPGLLRWILQKRPLYAGVLHNVSKDSENTMLKVLVLLQEKVMAPEMLVPRGLQSVLFGDATLEQLTRICADKTLELAGEFAYDILLELCTDPSHGLCPESTEIWEVPTGKTGAFGGGQARLLRLMNRLKVTEVDAHRNLLLATGRARPKFAAAYLASVPLSLEPRVSTAWFSAMSLVATLIPVACQPPPFSSLAAEGTVAPPHDGPLIRTTLVSLLPSALSRLALNRGLQHADLMVKHACLRVLYEALVSLRRLLEAVDAAATAVGGGETVQVSGIIGTSNDKKASPEEKSGGVSLEASWLKLSQSIQDTMRAHLPDPNILYGILHSIKASSIARGNGTVTTSSNDGSRVVARKRKRTDTSMNDETEEHQVSSSEKYDYESTILQLWGSEAVVDAGRRKDGEILLHAKVMEVLAAFQRVLPIALADTGFDAFKLVPENPISMPIVQQNALSALLLGVTGYSDKSSDKFRGVVGEFVGVGSAYKRLKPLLLLMLSTDSKTVSEAVYLIIQRIMVSTGAFDINPGEIRLWLDALIGWKVRKSHELRTVGETTVMDLRTSLSPGTTHASLVAFLAEAVSSITQNIYRYLDRLHHILSKVTLESDVNQRSPNREKDVHVAEFGPFVICTLDTCFASMRSGSKTTSQRAAAATYVASVLHMLLNCQVHPQALASVLLTELSSEAATTALKTFEGSSLRILLQHSEEILPSAKLGQLCGSSILGGYGQAQNPEGGKLLAVLKACKKNEDVAREAKLEALRSLLLCIPVDEILDTFPLLMEVCAKVCDGDSSTIVALLGVHPNLLANVSAAWPRLFSLALELAVAVKDRNGRRVTLNDLKISALESVEARNVSEAVGLCGLLLMCPFSILFSAAVHGNSGSLLMNYAFTKILQAAALEIPPSSWLCAVRVVISGLKHIVAISTDGESGLNTVFSLLCSFSLPTKLKSVGGSLTSLIADGEDVIGVYRRMVMDLINHPALYYPFLCSKNLSSAPCPFVSDLRRDKKDTKICDTSLRRVLATAASEVNVFDGHIVVLLTRLLESMRTLSDSSRSPSFVDQIQILRGEVLEACGSFVRKAMSILRKEVEESSSLGVIASPSLFTVYVLIPYSNLSLTTDFLMYLLSVGRNKVKKSKVAASPHVLGLHFATVFIDSLSGASKKQTLERQQSDMWKLDQQDEEGSESQLIFDLFERVLEQVVSNPSMLADLCLLSFLQAFDPKLAVGGESEELYRRFEKTRFADFARCTPLAVLRHCIMHPNKVTGAIATLLVESSSVHLCEFGWLISTGTVARSRDAFTGCRLSFAEKMLFSRANSQTLDLALSDEDLLILLPAVKVYLEVSSAKGSLENKEVVDHIAAVYGSYLGKQLKRWDKFVSSEAVKEWYLSSPLSRILSGAHHLAAGRMLEYCVLSPIGQVVRVLRICHSFLPLGNKLQKRLFNSLLSKANTPLVSLDGREIADDDICCLVCEAVARVDTLRYLLDFGLKLECGEIEEGRPVANGTVDQVEGWKSRSQKDSIALERFLSSLVYTLGAVYKSGGIDWKKEMADSSPARQGEPGRAQWLQFLEQLLLAQVIRTAEELSELSLDLTSFMPVYKYSLATFLGYRFGEPSAVKAARYLTILFLRCIEENKNIDRQVVDLNPLELLISHSKFLPSMLARVHRRMEIPYLSGKHAGKGTSLNALTSVLLLVGSPIVDHMDEPVEDKMEAFVKDSSLLDVDSSTASQNSLNDVRSDREAEKKIELVKLLRILVTLRLKQCNLDMTNSESPPLEQILSVLLAAYAGTMSEVDQEIFTLMHEIESHGGPGFSGLTGLDYLWGEAALKRRKAKSAEMTLSKSGLEGPTTAMELRRQTFKEDLLIDPRRCGLTVLFFPPKRPMAVSSVGHFQLAAQFKDCSQEHRGRDVGAVERELKSAAYDPAFLLPFAEHGLSVGFIGAEEFVRLGLLAVAFASISSAEETVRKAGYEILAKFYAVLETEPQRPPPLHYMNYTAGKHVSFRYIIHYARIISIYHALCTRISGGSIFGNVLNTTHSRWYPLSVIYVPLTLQECPSFKSRTQIRLLMTYVKNSVAEAWQKLPRVLSVFAAEASCILMNPENHHYLSINRFLLRAPSLDMESIPLFQIMFGSGSVQYRSDRLWMLRLLAAGLGSSLDAHIYRRKFVLELLMSFHDSAMADAFTRKWVLQVFYQAANVRSCSQYLVEHTGLLSWLASVAVNSCESNSSVQENGTPGELASVSLKVIESIVSWGVVQRHLLAEGAEELFKVALMFHRFLVRNSKSQYQKIFARPTISIMTLVLRMSHRRRKHQTHFTLNIVGIEEVVNWCEGGITMTRSSGRVEGRASCLKMILHSSPPAVIAEQDKRRLYDVASWAMQVVLQLELETVQSTANEIIPRLQGTGHQESISQKLLRWLAAALVLGDMSRVDDLNNIREKFTTCFSVVSVFRSTDSTNKDVDTSRVDAKLARLLLSLQGHVNTQAEVSSMITVVAAVSRLTPLTGFTAQDDGGFGASREIIKSILELLVSELPCPEEINSSWLWSFHGPWTMHGTRNLDEHGAVEARYVSEVCTSVFTFLQLLSSKRPTSFSSYLADLESGLEENRYITSSSSNDSFRVKVTTKLALLQESICRALQRRPLETQSSNKSE